VCARRARAAGARAFGSESMSVIAWRRRPGSWLIERSGRRARSERIAETLVSAGKTSGSQPNTTTTKSSRFHPSARYAVGRPEKPMAQTLTAISAVNARLKRTSSRSAHTGPIGASGLPGGPCTARTAELMTITTSDAASNQRCSQTEMQTRRKACEGGMAQHDVPSYSRPDGPTTRTAREPPGARSP
jgi:hypothetical protein